MQDRVGAPVSWGQFVELPEDDSRELVDGALVERPVPTKDHERIVARLIYHLQAWAIPRKAGEVLGSGYRVRISDTRGVMPDVQLLSPETFARADQAGLAGGRPELVVEVLSPANRSHDRVRKLEWYASIGVPDYWIVDPEARTLERLVLTGSRYTIAQTAADGVFRPEAFEGLEIPLTSLFGEAHG